MQDLALTRSVRVANAGLKVGAFSASCGVLVRAAGKGLGAAVSDGAATDRLLVFMAVVSGRLELKADSRKLKVEYREVPRSRCSLRDSDAS